MDHRDLDALRGLTTSRSVPSVMKDLFSAFEEAFEWMVALENQTEEQADTIIALEKQVSDLEDKVAELEREAE